MEMPGKCGSENDQGAAFSEGILAAPVDYLIHTFYLATNLALLYYVYTLYV